MLKGQCFIHYDSECRYFANTCSMTFAMDGSSTVRRFPVLCGRSHFLIKSFVKMA